MSHALRTALALVGAAALVTGTGALASAGTEKGRHEVSQAPAWTGHLRPQARMAAPGPVHAKVWLTPRDQDGLRKLAASVSDPASGDYGHFLSSADYGSRFAPSGDVVKAVQDWATGAGLHVDGVGAANHYVAVSGSAGVVSAAFTASLQVFSVAGHTGTAPTTAVTVPDALAGVVSAVSGLDMITHWASPAASGGSGEEQPNAASPTDLGPAPGFVNAGPCSSFYGQKVDTTDPAFEGKNLPYAVCGYVPKQLRSVYGVTGSRRNGFGTTIAIVDAFASPTIRKDSTLYSVRHGDLPLIGRQFSESNDTNYDPQRVQECGGNGWYGEQTLDVEAAHGMAPAANIAYYGAASCYDDDLMGALARVVTDNKASIVSNSWGESTYFIIDGVVYTLDQAIIDAYDSIFMQGAVQGIGFYFSSGDNGDELAAQGVKSPDYPAADPWVTTVGGTALAVDKRGQRAFETGWGTQRYWLTDGAWTANGFLYGAGGGCSDVFAKPQYQNFVQIPCGMRAVPDVAMDADPTTGMLVGQTQVFDSPNVWGQGTRYGEYRIGGTSLAAPLFAGIQADRQQRGGRIGFANFMLYASARTPGMFLDVKPEGDRGNVRVDYVNGLNATDGLRVSVRTFNEDSSLQTGPGWDEVTGIGTPTEAYIRGGRG